MADNKKWKPIVFTSIIILAFLLLLFLFIHRSNQRERLCPHYEELLHTDGFTGNSTCYREHTQGPCPSNMILYPNPVNQSVGICDCDFVHHERGLIYHNQTNQCYFIFKQAYCSPNEWLLPYKCEENLCARCILNPCGHLRRRHDDPAEWVQTKDGSCVQLGSPCGGDGEIIRFGKFKVFPVCEKEKEHKSLSFSVGGIGVPPTRCPPGYSRTSLGHCAPEFEFD